MVKPSKGRLYGYWPSVLPQPKTSQEAVCYSSRERHRQVSNHNLDADSGHVLDARDSSTLSSILQIWSCTD